MTANSKHPLIQKQTLNLYSQNKHQPNNWGPRDGPDPLDDLCYSQEELPAVKPAGKKGKEKKKKKGGSDALAAAFAALEVQPAEESAEAPAPLQEEDANGVADIAEVAQVTGNDKKQKKQTRLLLCTQHSQASNRAEG